ncbi:MAG: type II toxin-antitoxin system RelE/ParE family toxin [Oscillospiraceae bacterium]|nr:type II toxin-antitoxin system RelE/ParE family toxin [Oscillospiraceae bacterium]MBR7056935.1 type II toxin-antitoxin system RelE/ParE family toxin [Oscillospiraceae bacterium]
MPYTIKRTAKADEQLRDIVFYRAEVTGSVDAALDLLETMEKEIALLASFPESGAPPHYATLRARGYRVLIVEKQLVFYKVDPETKTVVIHAVVDGRRDYLNLI